MPVILIIDDQPFTRINVITALRDSGYKIRTVSNAALTDRIIYSVKPDLILVNRQPDMFDSIPVFMGIKEKYPEIPVLLYALKSDTGIRNLKQAITMAFRESHAVERKRAKLPMLRMAQQIQLFNRD